MALAFLKANPALYPLAAAMGLGVGGSIAFAGYYLTSSPDVVVNKKIRQPWNNVKQHQNSKLFSPNTDFWKGRVGLPDPRMAFMEDIAQTPKSKRTPAEESYLKRARALAAEKNAQEQQ